MTTISKARRRHGDTVPAAVIDIGSNSVRLVVYEGAKRSPSPLFNEKVLCGLGRELATTGRLADDSVDRALRALRRFRAIAGQIGAQSLHVVATAAAREAKNGSGFIRQAEEICGAKIAVLSGKREAKLAAAGVMAGFNEVNGLAADLGGGSLEIIDIKERALVGGVTLPLGGLRLIDVSGGDLQKAAEFVDDELARVDWLEQGKDRPFYAVGGTWRAFARLHMAQTRYPLRVMHGYRMSTEDALKFAHLLDHLSPTSLEGIEDVSKARRETVPFGALVMERLLRRVLPSEVLVSAFGVREGLVYRLLSDAEKERDPLLAACSDLAAQQSRSPEHADELCAWTDALFQSLDPPETAEQQRLRHAGCLLSDIGWQAHPDYRGKQSLNMIAHGAFAGIDHPGRAFLALTVYFRHEGLIDDDVSPSLRELVDDDMLRRARILGAALRTAHMISAAMPGVIEHTPVSREGKKLVLRLPDAFEVLDGERLERRFAVLAKELGIEPEIRTGDTVQKIAV
ncbi:MAG: exopolyphosphatase [Methyloligellaceae bacterium]